MDTAAELARGSEADHTHAVAILLAEEGDGAQLLGLLHRHVAMLVELEVLTDKAVDQLLHTAQLLVSDLLEVGEIEAQRVGADVGSLLLHMVAEHLLQRVVQEMGGGVVAGGSLAQRHIDAGRKLLRGVLRHTLEDVDALVVLALRVAHDHGLVAADELALVADLAAHLAIERRIVEHNLEEGGLLLLHLAVAQDVAGILRVVVAHKLLLALAQHDPVAVLHLGRIAGAGLLLGHLLVKLLLVDGIAVFAADQLRQVEGEAIGVEEAESLGATQFFLAVGLELVHLAVEEVDALVEGAEETVLLLLDHAGDELALGWQLGIGRAHLLDQDIDEAEHKGLFLTEEGVGVADGTAQDAADDVASLGIARQLAVGDGESHGAQMVSHHTHGDIDLLLVGRALILGAAGRGESVLQAREVLDLLDDGLEDVGIVVGVLALEDADEALEAHTRINHVHAELLQRPVAAAVVLHEDEVPDLDDLGIVLVDQFAARRQRLQLVGAIVDMDLRAGTAGARVAHLPKVVVLVAVDDMVLGHVLPPELGRLFVAGQAFLLVALEDRDVEVLGVEVENTNEILPGRVDGALLEVVAKRPVAQHLKHRVMVGVVADHVQVVVLAAHAKTLLRVGAAARLRILRAKYDVLPLIHARVGKHQRGVVLDDHRG